MYALLKVIVSRRIKSFWLRRLTAFNTQRSRRKKNTPYKETVDFFWLYGHGREIYSNEIQKGNLKSITKTFFLPLLTDISNSARLPRTEAKNEYSEKSRRPYFPWLGVNFDCKTNSEIVELPLIKIIYPL